jgi:ubiquitin-protein ligase E3 A
MLAALLPLMADSLPRDANGICVIPHRHSMEMVVSSEGSMYFTGSGRLAFHTNKVCDNCQSQIRDRQFYHCSANCDIDFCQDCHRKLEGIFAAFFEGEADEGDRDRRYAQLDWVIVLTERVAAHVLCQSLAGRSRLAHDLAFEWPTNLFYRLIRAVIDVVNAKVVHVQDVKDIKADERFWYTVGLLQFLYSANLLSCSPSGLDEDEPRGPKVDHDMFILEGINKCEPVSEWHRWREHPSAKVPDVLAMDTFRLTTDFCSFLTHNNLVPVSFRRVCLLWDVWEQLQVGAVRLTPLQIEVRRDPAHLLEDVLRTFEDKSDSQLRRPLRVTFEGEEGTGPGVTREFFQVVLRSILGANVSLFRYNEAQRTYWFNEGTDNFRAFRACGILLGQAVLNNTLVPNIFPRVLYECLLEDLKSPCARQVTLEDLATVSRETAQSLQRVLDYTGDDIGAVFGDLDWGYNESLLDGGILGQGNKAQFVQAHVDWFFRRRFAAQLAPLSEGFRAILGCSALLQSMVDAVQLEKIVCGGSVPVDVAAIRRGATHEGWSLAEESEYLQDFWDCVAGFPETEKVQFVMFVTASDRVPLRGWQDLNLIVHKNGVGDERLPTAHTCFCQLLLPRYSSTERLRLSLQLAIANSQGFGLR